MGGGILIYACSAQRIAQIDSQNNRFQKKFAGQYTRIYEHYCPSYGLVYNRNGKFANKLKKFQEVDVM